MAKRIEIRQGAVLLPAGTEVVGHEIDKATGKVRVLFRHPDLPVKPPGAHSPVLADIDFVGVEVA